MSKSIKIKAYAKFNYGLKILGQLDSGYHEINFLMDKINLYDEIKFTKSYKTKIHGSKIKSNIMVKVINEINEMLDTNHGLEIEIIKNIPISAGLGGGSANAAATIIAMDKLYNLKLTEKQKKKVASELGSDIFFCLYNRLSEATGTGNELKFIEKTPPATNMLIVNPKKFLSTRKVYENYDYEHNENSVSELINKIDDYDSFYGSIFNDLQKTSIKLEPEIGEIIERAKEKKCYSLMSGSGATVLIFSKSTEELEKLKEEFNKKRYYAKLILKNT